eukprot:UN06516
MKVATAIINNCGSDDESVDLLLETLRAMSYFGTTVDKSVFEPYIKPLMDTSAKLVKERDIDILKLFHIWSRVARVVGEKFNPFLQPIIEYSTKLLTQDIVLIHYDDVSENLKDKGITVHSDSGKAFDVNKFSQMETAFELLESLSQACPKSFSAKYLSVLSPIIEKQVVYKHHSDVRKFASQTLCGFLQCALAANNFKYCQKTALGLFNFLKEEKCFEVKNEIITKLYDYIESQRNNKENFPLRDMNVIMQICVACLIESGKGTEVKGNNDIVHSREEELFSRHIANFINLCFKIHKTTLLPIFEPYIQNIHSLLNSGCWYQKTSVMLILSDIIEYCDKSAIRKFTEQILPSFWNFISSGNIDARESAFIAIGTVIEKFPELIQNKYNIVLQESFKQFENKNNSQNNNNRDVSVSYEMEGGELLAAASATILKILVAYEQCDNFDSYNIYKMWFHKCFPLTDGEFSTRYIYKTMTLLLEKIMNHF